MPQRSSQNPASADENHPWTTYIDAREEVRRRGDRKVGTEHLLLALLREPDLASALGVNLHTARAALEAMDRDALRVVGMHLTLDLLPLTPFAKAALRESSMEMRGFRGRHLGPRHVLDVLLQQERSDLVAELLARLGIERVTVRAPGGCLTSCSGGHITCPGVPSRGPRRSRIHATEATRATNRMLHLVRLLRLDDVRLRDGFD